MEAGLAKARGFPQVLCVGQEGVATLSWPWTLTQLSLQARPGCSSVCRARRTWHTWTTGPTRQGGRRSKTPASSRSLPTATLVGLPSLAQKLSNLLLLSSSLSVLPSCCLCLARYLPGLVSFFTLSSMPPLLPGSVSSSGCSFPAVSSPSLAPIGLLFVTNIDSSDPDQLVYKTLDAADRLAGPAGDLARNSYLGL